MDITGWLILCFIDMEVLGNLVTVF